MLIIRLIVKFFIVASSSETFYFVPALSLGKFISEVTIRCRVLKVDIGMSFLCMTIPPFFLELLYFRLHKVLAFNSFSCSEVVINCSGVWNFSFYLLSFGKDIFRSDL